MPGRGELPDGGLLERLALFVGAEARFFHQAFVECGKRLFLHVDFAPHLEHRRGRTAQLLGDVGNMRDVGRDVLAHLAVAARRRAYERAVLVAQRA